MLKAANTDIRNTVLALKEVTIRLQGGLRKRQGYGKSQYTVLPAVIEKTQGYDGSQEKMIQYHPSLGASKKATQRQLA